MKEKGRRKLRYKKFDKKITENLQLNYQCEIFGVEFVGVKLL